MKRRRFHIVVNASDPVIGAYTLCNLPAYRRSFVDLKHMSRVADFCDPCYLAAERIREATKASPKKNDLGEGGTRGQQEDVLGTHPQPLRRR